MYAKPLPTSIIASVTMKGGMPNRVIIAPENPPMTPHSITAAAHARNIPTADASAPPAKSRMNFAASTADSASKLPTERSMPPVMITIVMPMATMAITAI